MAKVSRLDLIHSVVSPEEMKEVGGVALFGTIIRPNWTLRQVQAHANSKAQDRIHFHSKRIVVMRIKDVGSASVRDLWAANRGDLSRLVDHDEYPRKALREFEIPSAAPPNLRVFGDITFARIGLDAGEIFMLTPEIDVDRVRGLLSTYASGTA